MVVGDLIESSEVVVIGSGPGGYVAAIRLAQLGKEVTVITQDKIPGGVCLLSGCIPSKALIEAAKRWEIVQNSKSMGILSENPSLDFKSTQNWKNKIVQQLGQGVSQLLQGHRIRVMQGRASFSTSHQLKVETEQGLREIRFEQAIIATGSASRELPDLDFDHEFILSSEDILQLQEIPQSLLIVGAGYIGLELGQVFAKLGSKVTIIEAMEEILPELDEEILRPLKRKLKASNIEIKLKTQIQNCEKKNQKLKITLRSENAQPESLEADKILIAIGRSPHSKNLGLEALGIEVDSKGFITVNEKCQTMLSHIYAIGDVTGGMMLAHKASRQGIVAAANIAGHPDAFDNIVPAVIFSDPEIAYVGLSEKKAKSQGLQILTGTFNFAANGRALTLEENTGLVKIIAEKVSKRIIGAQMCGPHVSDLIAELTLAIEMGARLEDLALSIHPHPTLSEAVHEATESAMGMAIHQLQKKSFS